ncbi:MAG TPA: pitrilysin family protein [Candidatus Binataceae bacterium]|nr:pitrilysin family protein [Candidatus Binataceae bacterium]
MSDNVKTATLPNGLRVLVLENHKAPVVTFHIFYKVGSRNEQVGKTGLAHLLEHLMFRGTKKYKPEEIDAIIQENGGDLNAMTSEDFTEYFENINRDHLDVPISVEADRMANLDPKGFDAEKAVVMEERRMRTEDNPEDALDELSRAQAYIEHPYHWPTIGWMHDIQGLTLDDALAFHAIYYSPQNALIVTVGDFDADKVMKQISEQFGSIKNGPKPPPFDQIEPPQEGERRVILRHAANLPAIEESFHVPNLKNPDAYPLEVLSEVLADGKSSRLYQDLVIEKRLVVGTSAGSNMLSFDAPLFTFSAQMRPNVKADEVLAEVDRQIKMLQDKPVGADELQKAKNLEQAEFVYGQDSIFNQAMQLGTYELLGNYKMIDQYIPSIDNVTAADVQRVAQKYLVKDNRTVAILEPTGLLPKQAGGGPSGGMVHHSMSFDEEGGVR